MLALIQAGLAAVGAFFGFAKGRSDAANTQPMVDNKTAQNIEADRVRLEKNAAKDDLEQDRKDASE